MTSDPPENHVSVFPWPGGKGRRSDWIISRMPPHDCYVEVFGGSAAILYNKPPSHNEVYNDVNDDLVQFFEVLRNRSDELAEWLECVPYARSVYEEWVHAFFDGYRPDDPIERAGRFFALRHMQFAGDARMPNGFKVRNYWNPARSFNNARERLFELADRFAEVTIEHRDWIELVDGYGAQWNDPDDPDVLFYLDPPYVGQEYYYDVTFDHEAFVDGLADIEGRWMLSYTELPDGLADYHVLDRTRRHRMCRGNDAETTEHLVCNFDPDRVPSFIDTGSRQSKLASISGGVSSDD